MDLLKRIKLPLEVIEDSLTLQEEEQSLYIVRDQSDFIHFSVLRKDLGDLIVHAVNTVHTSEQGFEAWNKENEYMIDLETEEEILKLKHGQVFIEEIYEWVKNEREGAWLASNNRRRELIEVLQLVDGYFKCGDPENIDKIVESALKKEIPVSNEVIDVEFEEPTESGGEN